MEMTFDDIYNKRHSKLYKDVLVSFVNQGGDYKDVKEIANVKFIVNGKEVNPEILERVWENIDGYIELRAKELLNEKFADALHKANMLCSTIQEASENIYATLEHG